MWELHAGCPNDLHILLASTLGVSSVAKICAVPPTVVVLSGLGRDLNTAAVIYHRVGCDAVGTLLFHVVNLELASDKDNEPI